jgi:cytoplasmic iron level regulating protein YaaA (DUF328/UPF0246 family)
MNTIKNYVKNNSQTLFKSVDTINNIVFDNRGFLFSDKAQAKYNEICDLPHIYVAWVDGNDGFLYIGKSFQNGGRWKRSHAYHLGTLAYHLLNTMQSDDQNHQHWIDSWMKTETMKLGHCEHFIHLIKEVKICFIPFKIYSEKELSKLDSIEIREINKRIETTLIQSYLNDGFKLLNVQNNLNVKSANKKLIKSTIIDNSIKNDNQKNNFKCVDFRVKKDESAHEKIQNTNLQNDLVYSIEIFETTNTRNFICEYYNKTKIPFKYFGNADTSKERLINGKEPARWKVIQKVMNENNINEVTIRLCPIVNNPTASNKIKLDNKPNNPVMKTNENEKTSADEKIDLRLKSVDWLKIKTNAKKLLIIGCSDSKIPGGNPGKLKDYFKDEEYTDLIEKRTTRFNSYKNLLSNDSKYFENISRGDSNYFREQHLSLPAIERYSGGKFFTQNLIQLYKEKNKDSNLHILIVSGLYGVIEFNDSIIDYHLEINKIPFWNNNNVISEAIIKYIKSNDISNEFVFYSLSNKYKLALKPLKSWNDLWILNGRLGSLATSSKLVHQFLDKL